jgi:hypothetical protein
MEIVEVTQPTKFRLSEQFLAPYYKRVDPFKSLLARSTYLSKYCRGGETWTDTIRRVVEGNVSLAPNVAPKEAELCSTSFGLVRPSLLDEVCGPGALKGFRQTPDTTAGTRPCMTLMIGVGLRTSSCLVAELELV